MFHHGRQLDLEGLGQVAHRSRILAFEPRQNRAPRRIDQRRENAIETFSLVHHRGNYTRSEAEAQRLLNEAENVLSDQARYSLFRRKLLDRIEGIVRESVKPMEKIEGIRILQVDGLNGGGNGATGRSTTDEVIDSALRYRVQAPLIDSILADIGVEGGSLSKLPGLIREARDMQSIRKEEAAKKEAEGAPPPHPAGGGTPPKKS